MKIVISIAENWEERIGSMSDSEIADYLYNVIRNTGTPLPKGHGRLIDASALFQKLFVNKEGKVVPDRDIDNFPIQYGVNFVKMAIHEALTIIGADMEGNEYGRYDAN